MKKDGGDTDSSSRPPLGERVLWYSASPDHECDCPGPPPQFYLPPPPRPSSLDCSRNLAPNLETCEAVPVIDAEYHYSPAIPSLAIILPIAGVVVVLLLGTFLVALKKSSPQNGCNAAASINGVVYEDLTNIHPRFLSPQCPPPQTTLPSIEMIDIISYADRTMFGPVFLCPKSSVEDSYNSQELFNPVYEELSNGSEERGETDSEGISLQAAVSEDEFAEDELSLGGELDIRLRPRGQQGNDCLRESVGNDPSKDADFSDADDKSKFLENSRRNSSFPREPWEKGKKTGRGTIKRTKNLDKRKLLKNKGPPQSAPPVNRKEFHEGCLMKKILQIYPDVTGIGFKYSEGSPDVASGYPLGEVHYESVAAFGQTPSCRLKAEVFSTFGALQNFPKNQSQDSSLGSDSGYSNNTSGGKSSSKSRKEYRLSNRSDPVLS